MIGAMVGGMRKIPGWFFGDRLFDFEDLNFSGFRFFVEAGGK